jgi:ankyrin repeat protein
MKSPEWIDAMCEPGDVLGAVYRKDLSVLERLTRQQTLQRDDDGRTLLMHAILASDADPAVVQLLIDRGAEVDTADDGQRWTALHFAARDENDAIVSRLLHAGAAVDPVDVFGNTPLWRSVMNARTDLAAIRNLLEHGADPRRKNRYGKSPIDVARDTGRDDIAALLVGHDALPE